MTNPDNIARLVSRYDQDLASAVDWWNERSSQDRQNLLRLLCDERMPISSYRGLNDAALKILRDLAVLALARLVIGHEGNTEEIVL